MKLIKCHKCNEKAHTWINSGETPLCAYHYINQEDEECLKASLKYQIYERGKINESKSIQREIKNQKPSIYSDFRGYFDV